MVAHVSRRVRQPLSERAPASRLEKFCVLLSKELAF